MVQTIVLGLDGANWALLSPWLDEDILPHIDSLRQDGIAVDMESCFPPVTCPNWRCYSTGKNPGKLGVYWWETIDMQNRSLETPNSRSFESANFWDYLSDDGLSSGIVNLPMTYPPFDLEGFMVSGGPGSEQDEYTAPPSLEATLEADGYRLHPDVPVTSKEDRDAAAGVVDLIDERLETFRELLGDQDIDVAHCTVFYINVLQHFFWRGEPTKRAWELIDDHIGKLREEYPDANLFLMSDHGCAEIETVFYANSWLEREGYLSTNSDVSDLAGRAGINKKRISKLAHRFGIHDLVTTLAPDALKNRVPEDEEGVKREQKLEKVDWDRTRAIASGQGLVYTTDEETRDAVIEGLEALESDITGKPIASEVLRREDAYDGPHVSKAPDVVFDQTVGVHTSGAIGNNPVFDDVGHWEAENVRTGFFLASGPDVTDGGLETPISILDIAPTVLASVECPIPTDMDGDPLPVFGDRGATYREPIPYDDVAGQSAEDVQQRLADLGYLE